MKLTGKKLQQIARARAESLPEVLSQDYSTIIPGRYLDKEHWVSVGAGSGISEDLIKDLVEDSYELVRESLPQKVPAQRLTSALHRCALPRLPLLEHHARACFGTEIYSS